MNCILHSAAEHPEILRDESRKIGCAEYVAWPTTPAEVAELLRRSDMENIPVTLQGARTGISAGAVPEGGMALNLARLDRFGPVLRDTPAGPLVRVQAGFPLDPLRRALEKEAPDLCFAPDPTEASASIGGMAACNASGARSFAYGPMREHVHALTVVLADGSTARLERGRDKARGRAFEIKSRGGRVLVAGELPIIRRPRVKNVAGYYTRPDMDLLDLFIGSDGTLGAIVSLDLKLLKAPAIRWGLMCFAPGNIEALDLADALRAARPAPVALEYFDGRTLELLRDASAADSRIPAPPLDAGAALYAELSGDDEGEAEAMMEAVMESLESAGVSADDVWFADSERDMKRLKDFRHAVPESVNALVDRRRKTVAGLTKIGTDFALPVGEFRAFLEMQYADSRGAGLEYLAFGHVGDCHVHLNLLPRSEAEKDTAWRLLRRWAREAALRGGTVAAEHGVGKLKADLLPILYGPEAMAEMLRLKRLFDPRERLGRGNWFRRA